MLNSELLHMVHSMQATIEDLTRAVRADEKDLDDCKSLIKAYHEYAMGFNHVAGIDALRELYDLSVDAARLCANETMILKHRALEED